MSVAAGGGGGSLVSAASGCISAGSPYAASAGGGAGAAGGAAGVAGRLPARVLEHIFSYLELSDLVCCGFVCWHWNNILADENSEVWRSLCTRTLSDEAMRSDILCNLPTYKGKVRLQNISGLLCPYNLSQCLRLWPKSLPFKNKLFFFFLNV